MNSSNNNIFDINTFKDDLKTSGILTTMLGEFADEVICISLVGSRCIKVVDNLSDIDIVVWVADFKDNLKFTRYFPKYTCTYHGIDCHWSYEKIKTLFTNDINTEVSYKYPAVTKIQFSKFSDEMILYKNPSFSEVLDKLYSLKNLISRFGCFCLYDINNDGSKLISKIISEEIEFIPFESYSKYLYHFVYASDILFNKEFDKEFLAKIKRIKDFIPLTKKSELLAINKIKSAAKYIYTNQNEFKNLSDKLYVSFLDLKKTAGV